MYSSVSEESKDSSPSRRYVAFLHKMTGSHYVGHRAVYFELPLAHPYTGDPMENNVSKASWYYLNYLDSVGYLATVVPYEVIAELVTGMKESGKAVFS